MRPHLAVRYEKRGTPASMASLTSPAKRAAQEEEGQRSEVQFSRKAAGLAQKRNGSCPDDEGVYRFRRGYGGGISGRRRLTAIKRAIYKLNNNNTVAVAA